MTEFGLTKDIITLDQHIFGSEDPQKGLLQPNGDWSPFLPSYEPQFNDQFDTYGCTIWGTLNALEILMKRVYGIEYNFSERFIYIISHTRPPGNSPHTIAEYIRKFGLVQNETLPMTDSFEEFLTPDPMIREILAEAGQWRNKYQFRHKWVFNGAVALEEKKRLLREALRISPVGVSVRAWIQDGDTYTKTLGAEDNHWCVLIREEMDGRWRIFDSYDHSEKLLSKDFDFGVAKQYTLTEAVSFWQRFINLFKK